jgi:hypothetical protein
MEKDKIPHPYHPRLPAIMNPKYIGNLKIVYSFVELWIFLSTFYLSIFIPGYQL